MREIGIAEKYNHIPCFGTQSDCIAMLIAQIVKE
jgi:hypothetical protein